jgi:hypothetical protein
MALRKLSSSGSSTAEIALLVSAMAQLDRATSQLRMSPPWKMITTARPIPSAIAAITTATM